MAAHKETRRKRSGVAIQADMFVKEESKKETRERKEPEYEIITKGRPFTLRILM